MIPKWQKIFHSNNTHVAKIEQISYTSIQTIDLDKLYEKKEVYECIIPIFRVNNILPLFLLCFCSAKSTDSITPTIHAVCNFSSKLVREVDFQILQGKSNKIFLIGDTDYMYST